MRITARTLGGHLVTTTHTGALLPVRTTLAARRLPVRRAHWIGLLTVLAVILMWWLLTGVTGTISPVRFPSPAAFLAALGRIGGEGYAGGPLW